MGNIYRIIAFSAAALCTTFAHATEHARADVPFSFTVKGHSFPAGQYDITMDSTKSFITLSSRTNPALVIVNTLGPADPIRAAALLRFDVIGGSHSLETIKMGVRSTSDLDVRSKRTVDAAIGTTTIAAR